MDKKQELLKQLLEIERQENQEPQDIGNINIPNLIIWMKKQAYEETTIKRVIKELKHIIRNCDSRKPEEVKLFIANKQCENGRKENLIEAYDKVIKSLGMNWKKPFYQRKRKKRRSPKEELLNFIIDNVNFPLNLKLSMHKDLGNRPIELTWLKVKDIDLTTGATSITGAKHTIGREGKLKTKSLELLKRLIQRDNLNADSLIFPTTSENLSQEYRHARNNLANKTKRPELKQVQLYDFRRRKATREYKLSHHNFLHVKKILGHKDARSTEKYITEDEQIEWEPIKAISDKDKKDCFAKDYEFMTNDNGIFWFRKPKD
jgi:integrase